MGAITQTPLRDMVVDFSYPYFFTSLGVASKKPSPLSKLMAIIWPFSKQLWICLIVATVIVIMIYWTLMKIDKKSCRKNFSFAKSVQEICQMLLMQGMNYDCL